MSAFDRENREILVSNLGALPVLGIGDRIVDKSNYKLTPNLTPIAGNRGNSNNKTHTTYDTLFLEFIIALFKRI